MIQKGPADGILESGDILLKLNGEWINAFIPFEEILDSHVGNQVHLTLQRGLETIDKTITVKDLHSITPSRYVEIGGGIVHELSYQMAEGYMVPTGGVYVASAGYMFGLAGISRKYVIESINNEPTPDLDAFIKVFATLKDNEQVPVSHYALSDVNKSRVSIIQVDRRWHPFRLANRNGTNINLDSTGLWDYTALPDCIGQATWVIRNASTTTLNENLGPARFVVPSLVNIEFHLPFKMDGVAHQVHFGLGLVLDSKMGIIVTDRNAIPTTIGDVLITFANSIIIPGKIVCLHQVYNIAFVKYDPSLLGTTVVKDAVLSPKPINQNDSVYLVCMSKSYQPIVRKTVVTNIRQFFVAEPIPPSYRSMNIEGIELENPSNNAGVIVTETGEIQALYPAFTKHNSKQRSEFFIGLPIDIVSPILKSLRNGETPKLYTLEAELTYTQIAHARTLGLSDKWVERIEQADPDKRNIVVVVRRVTSG